MPETQGNQTHLDILRRIVATKEKEVEALLRRSGSVGIDIGQAPPVRDLASALRREGQVALMAEVKRRSPGAGPIRPGLDPAATAGMYEAAGAAAVSVLTDTDYFGGSLGDMAAVRDSVSVPVFRKDFVIHPIQLAEARGAGADGVLLIARILDRRALSELHEEALQLGLTPLVEVHDAMELERALEIGAPIVGINNRNLRTFTTSLEVTLGLLDRVPPDVTVVSESGIRSGADVDRLGAVGVDGVLVGEALLRAPDPAAAASELVGRRRVARGSSGRVGPGKEGEGEGESLP